MIRAWRRLAIAAVTLLVGAQALGQVTVTVDGSVVRPGAQVLKAEARLLDATRAAGVRPDAYLLGAAWLNGDELARQRKLKVGVLFDLGVLEREARLDDEAGLAKLVARLAEQVRAMPVSGRRVATLDPVRLELESHSNRLLRDGDRLVFPPRPETVTVTGAVRADCTLPFVGLRDAAAYLADCPRHADADTDWFYILQPDGEVTRRGIALWNRDLAQPLAPGARLVVPLRASLLKDRAESLNDELAAFLSSQPLPLAGGPQ